MCMTWLEGDCKHQYTRVEVDVNNVNYHPSRTHLLTSCINVNMNINNGA